MSSEPIPVQTTPAPAPVLKTHTAACHCGDVKVKVNVDLSATGRCNCTVCVKKRSWNARVAIEEFTLVAGADACSVYTLSGAALHHFCKRCGVSVYSKCNIPTIGEFYTVSVNCLDGLTADELAAIPIRYSDGLNNNWWNPPTVTCYL
ncbi:hypothetical protein SAMD00019534_036750 [Acytostelium subglobosum LB1]|uniref:hypothetical protein n=1 Tax=Acytostelium subglobosum LB1 TaxID=1410327 RepID=UPI000644E6A2|nr:hypothetical protein SAMD00019534_036750 [Acytostelium subglobosum LB1]GAM20500.1 hypothetical protein SAMD00019534_036750 [Acytostelium subglobosum LB1]|eukprot:XP_012760021.1 hypothetical protein SAMD00019534_036750 [Acytostelium subglobosum LB1]